MRPDISSEGLLITCQRLGPTRGVIQLISPLFPFRPSLYTLAVARILRRQLLDDNCLVSRSRSHWIAILRSKRRLNNDTGLAPRCLPASLPLARSQARRRSPCMVGGDGIAHPGSVQRISLARLNHAPRQICGPFSVGVSPRLARLCKLHLSPEPSALFCNTFSKPVLAPCRIP